MKKIITLSREFGAGAGEIGRKVAQELGYEYVDKEIILQTARKSGIEVELIAKLEEKAPSVFGFTQSLFDMYNSPLDDKLFNIQKEIIQKIGEKGNCVIVGRNANSILWEYDNSFHIFVSANSHWKAERIKKELMPEATEQKILQHMAEVDKARKKYCSYYTNTEFGDARYYDLCLRTSTIGIDQSVKLICDLARS